MLTAYSLCETVAARVCTPTLPSLLIPPWQEWDCRLPATSKQETCARESSRALQVLHTPTAALPAGNIQSRAGLNPERLVQHGHELIRAASAANPADRDQQVENKELKAHWRFFSALGASEAFW